EICERTIRSSDRVAFDYEFLGLSRLMQGRSEEARRALERAAELDASEPTILRALAVIRYETGDAQGSAEVFRRLGEPANDPLRLLVARAWALLDRPGRARELLESAPPSWAALNVSLQLLTQAERAESRLAVTSTPVTLSCTSRHCESVSVVIPSVAARARMPIPRRLPP